VISTDDIKIPEFTVPNATLVVLVALAVGVAWVLYAENRKLADLIERYDTVTVHKPCIHKPCNCDEAKEVGINGSASGSVTSDSQYDSGTIPESESST